VTPAAEYKRLRSEVADLIVRLHVEVIETHAKRQAERPEYWTYVADLKHARIDLLHVLAFLGDLEAKERLLGEGESR
jgi:hypothetical protein